MTRYGYQDIPDGYTDVDPEQEESPAYYMPETVCTYCQGDGFVSVGEGLFVCPKCHGEQFVLNSLKGADHV